MPNNLNTEYQRESPPLDAEDWQIVFKVYAEHPRLALLLAYHLTKLKSYLRSQPKNISEAVAAIDRAVDGLYPHTEFHQVGHKLYRLVAEGTVTTQQERVIRQLGMKV